MKGRLGLLAALLLAAGPVRAQLLSLYPERSPRDRQASLDGLESWHPRLALGQWRPYGLPATVQELELLAAPADLELSLFAARQDWGPLGAWRLRARLLRRLPGGGALGLAWTGERLDAGRSASGLELEAALGQGPVLGLATRLAGPAQGAPPPRAAAAHLGLSLAAGDWTLRLWREQAGPMGVEEGLALERQLGVLALECMAQWPGWQGLALRIENGHWGLVLEERLHPVLGVSHGLRLLLR